MDDSCFGDEREVGGDLLVFILMGWMNE